MAAKAQAKDEGQNVLVTGSVFVRWREVVVWQACRRTDGRTDVIKSGQDVRKTNEMNSKIAENTLKVPRKG